MEVKIRLKKHPTMDKIFEIQGEVILSNKILKIDQNPDSEVNRDPLAKLDHRVEGARNRGHLDSQKNCEYQISEIGPLGSIHYLDSLLKYLLRISRAVLSLTTLLITYSWVCFLQCMRRWTGALCKIKKCQKQVWTSIVLSTTRLLKFLNNFRKELGKMTMSFRIVCMTCLVSCFFGLANTATLEEIQLNSPASRLKMDGIQNSIISENPSIQEQQNQKKQTEVIIVEKRNCEGYLCDFKRKINDETSLLFGLFLVFCVFTLANHILTVAVNLLNLISILLKLCVCRKRSKIYTPVAVAIILLLPLVLAEDCTINTFQKLSDNNYYNKILKRYSLEANKCLLRDFGLCKVKCKKDTFFIDTFEEVCFSENLNLVSGCITIDVMKTFRSFQGNKKVSFGTNLSEGSLAIRDSDGLQIKWLTSPEDIVDGSIMDLTFSDQIDSSNVKSKLVNVSTCLDLRDLLLQAEKSCSLLPFVKFVGILLKFEKSKEFFEMIMSLGLKEYNTNSVYSEQRKMFNFCAVGMFLFEKIIKSYDYCSEVKLQFQVNQKAEILNLVKKNSFYFKGREKEIFSNVTVNRRRILRLDSMKEHKLIILDLNFNDGIWLYDYFFVSYIHIKKRYQNEVVDGKATGITSEREQTVLWSNGSQILFKFWTIDENKKTLYNLADNQIKRLYYEKEMTKISYEYNLDGVNIFYDAHIFGGDGKSTKFPEDCKKVIEKLDHNVKKEILFCPFGFTNSIIVDKNKFQHGCKHKFGCDKFWWKFLLVCFILLFWYQMLYIVKALILNVINLIRFGFGFKGFCKYTSKLGFGMKVCHYKLLQRKFLDSYKLISKYYFFPAHLALQILAVLILPINFVLNCKSSTKLKVFLLLYPVRFWFGSAEAWVSSGSIPSCDGFEEQCKPLLYKNLMQNFFHCVDNSGKLQLNHFDRNIRTAQVDKSVLVSEDCTGDACIYTRTYRTALNLYPCKKMKLEKMNKEVNYLVIEDVDENIEFEYLEFFGPLSLQVDNAELTCGHSMCTTNLQELNDQNCRHKCLKDLGKKEDDWRDSDGKSYAFWKLFFKDNKKTACYKSPYWFRCKIYEHNCWSPIFSIYGFSKREEIELVTYKNSPLSWFFVLVELKKVDLNVNVRIISGNEVEKFKLSKDDNFNILEDHYTTKIKRSDELAHKFLLIGFENNDEGVFSNAMYEIIKPSDVQDLFKVGFRTGWPILGFNEHKKYCNDLMALDMNYNEIVKLLNSKFKKFTKDENVGYMVRKDKNEFKDFECVEPEQLSEIKKEFGEIEESKCKYVKPILTIFRHEVSYGVMSIEVETKESVKKQELLEEEIELEFVKCEGNNYQIGGYLLEFKRKKSSTVLGVFECDISANHCGHFLVDGKEGTQKVRITSSLIGDHTFVQTKPRLSKPNKFKVFCKNTQKDLDPDEIGHHAKSGFVFPENMNWKESVGEIWEDLKFGYHYILNLFDFSKLLFLIVCFIVVFILLIKIV